MLAYVPPVPLETLDDARIIRVARAVACVDYDVGGGQFMLVKPKRFSDQPLDVVAPHGISNGASGDGKPQARRRSRFGPCEHGEHGIGRTFRVTVNAIEIGLFM